MVQLSDCIVLGRRQNLDIIKRRSAFLAKNKFKRLAGNLSDIGCQLRRTNVTLWTGNKVLRNG